MRRSALDANGVDMVFSWRMAEVLAEAHLQAIGFRDARVTRGGADEGLDVVGTGVAAQVKYQVQPVGRPAIQNLIGAAANHSDSSTVFYASAGYTAGAIQYASAVGAALFTFDEFNDVLAVNSIAEDLTLRTRHSVDPAQFLVDSTRVIDGVDAIKKRAARISRVATSMAQNLFDEHTALADSGRVRSARFRAVDAFAERWPAYQRRAGSLGISFPDSLANDLPRAFREIDAASAKLDVLETELAAAFRGVGDFPKQLRQDPGTKQDREMSPSRLLQTRGSVGRVGGI